MSTVWISHFNCVINYHWKGFGFENQLWVQINCCHFVQSSVSQSGICVHRQKQIKLWLFHFFPGDWAETLHTLFVTPKLILHSDWKSHKGSKNTSVTCSPPICPTTGSLTHDVLNSVTQVPLRNKTASYEAPESWKIVRANNNLKPSSMKRLQSVAVIILMHMWEVWQLTEWLKVRGFLLFWLILCYIQ